MKKPKRAVIIGAGGYTGAELIRLLRGHPFVNIAALAANTQAGQAAGESWPHLQTAGLPPLVKLEEVDFSGVDVAFCCLPHGTAQEVIAALPEHLVIIDLSADFRLRDPAVYAQWYGHAHRAPELQKSAVYGLTEHYRERIRAARLIACPGCYPTSALLALIPLVRTGGIEPESLVIDAKSGVTGAGRSPKQNLLFTEVNEGVSAYGVGSHRHAPEIEQELGLDAVSFTPHLIPMSRGILSTIHARLTPGTSAARAREALAAAYAGEPFVHVLEGGNLPSTHQVRGGNHCHINLFAGRPAGSAVIVSAIDNLVKGASGQAVQNMNIRFGWPETAGLEGTALFP